MISERLQYIIDVVPILDTIADIGTDHGYIPVNLIKKSKAKKIIASDISKQSLQKAKDIIIKNHFENLIDTRLGNGIDILDIDETDGIIIAGMGGILISKILETSYSNKFINKKPVLILQPVQQAKELRYYLYENNFKITDEYVMQENNKIYHIIIAEKHHKTDDKYNKITKNKDIYMEFGLINIEKKSELLSKIVKNNIEKIKLLINELSKKSVEQQHIDLLKDRLKNMEDIYYETWGACPKA
ncbi:hypothetical protein HMPREF9629_01429 [Peptoanaerobacter stomatis]|uniref:PF04816 family protein n=1 Tax=Peptoanaerobacter stomatis TaxID=796937 RepID=G9WZ28_9FIRM|nr:tRNA (adenine(22)-N(1))-methyltransferase TrmK [Peptoanaerobacter stomatis]EHL16173.1 hypothetical protein HMPREF9629_01429 [Peptoanaerobacter stomatis]